MSIYNPTPVTGDYATILYVNQQITIVENQIFSLASQIAGKYNVSGGTITGTIGPVTYLTANDLVTTDSSKNLISTALLAGTNISIVNGTGTITINSTGGGGVPTGSANIIPYYNNSAVFTTNDTNLRWFPSITTLTVNGAIACTDLSAPSNIGTGELTFSQTSGINITNIFAQPSSGTLNFSLPPTLGTSGQVLTTNGANPALLTWATPSASAINTGNLIYVDAVYGNNSTGAVNRFDLPFLTITAAVAAASGNTTIQVRPGNYTSETFPITPPTNTCIIGLSSQVPNITTQGVVISSSASVPTTYFLLSNPNTQLSNLAIISTISAGGLTIIGIQITASTGASTCSINNCIIQLNSAQTSGNVIGIQYTGAGVGAVYDQLVFNTTVYCSASLNISGNIYGINITSNGSVRINNCIFDTAGGTGSSAFSAITGGIGFIFLSNCKLTNNQSGTNGDYSGRIHCFGNSTDTNYTEMSLLMLGNQPTNYLIVPTAPSAQRTVNVQDPGATAYLPLSTNTGTSGYVLTSTGSSSSSWQYDPGSSSGNTAAFYGSTTSLTLSGTSQTVPGLTTNVIIPATGSYHMMVTYTVNLNNITPYNANVYMFASTVLGIGAGSGGFMQTITSPTLPSQTNYGAYVFNGAGTINYYGSGVLGVNPAVFTGSNTIPVTIKIYTSSTASTSVTYNTGESDATGGYWINSYVSAYLIPI